MLALVELPGIVWCPCGKWKDMPTDMENVVDRIKLISLVCYHTPPTTALIKITRIHKQYWEEDATALSTARDHGDDIRCTFM